MTLHRIDTDKAWEHWKRNTYEYLEEAHVVVPVEPCEHGKLDGHPVACDFCGIDGCADDYEWCPGAGIGGDG
jgi:hypothetical protein